MSRHLTGLPAWLIQRLSAFYMALVTIFLVLCWPLFGADLKFEWRGKSSR